MSDKKEVLDYLRNQQKAAEIEAKMYGVNIWVLLGAMAVVGWQLTSTSSASLWGNSELMARTCLVSVSLHLLAFFTGPRSGRHDELRYSPSDSGTDSQFLTLLSGVLVLLPPAITWILSGISVGNITLTVLGLLLIAIGGQTILEPIVQWSEKKERFPEPKFGPTRRADAFTTLSLFGLLLLALGEQIVYFYGAKAGISVDDAKAMLLLTVFYLLVLISVNRMHRNHSIAWTYDLEADLVLGTISADVAIRKIENQKLGPRMQDVMDRFFDDLDKRFTALDYVLTQCAQKINDAKAVPEEYATERASRLSLASENVYSTIELLIQDCEQFRSYLNKHNQNPSGRKSAPASVLESLKARLEDYEKQARKAKRELEKMIA
jgi:hypothetical protein